MLRFLRQARGFSLATLLLFVGTVPESLSALMHEADDVLCQPTLVVHDESAHRVGQARVNVQEPQHCAVCHWLRSLQTATHTDARIEPVVSFEPLVVSSPVFAVHTAVADLPARAPPRV